MVTRATGALRTIRAAEKKLKPQARPTEKKNMTNKPTALDFINNAATLDLELAAAAESALAALLADQAKDSKGESVAWAIAESDLVILASLNAVAGAPFLIDFIVGSSTVHRTQVTARERLDAHGRLVGVDFGVIY